MVGFVGMLLVANQSMHSGMEDASSSAAGALDVVERYVNEWVGGFRFATVDGSKDVYNSVKRDILDPLPQRVSVALTDEFLADASELVSRVKWAGRQAMRTHSLLSLVNDTTGDLQGSMGKEFIRKLNELTQAVETVLQLCNSTLQYDPLSPDGSSVSPPTQKLLLACQQIIDHSHLLVPRPSKVTSEIFESLPFVYTPMREIDKVVQYDLINAAETRSTYFSQDILHHVDKDVQVSVNDALRVGKEKLQSAENYFDDIKKSVNDMLNKSLGLPGSKHRAKDSIDKYVLTYERYRFDLSCVLCSAVLIAVVVLLMSTAVGAWRSAIPLQMSAAARDQAHFCGRLLFKIESVFLLLISLSLVLFAVLVFAASVVGASCGSSRNFSEIIDNVIDNEDNWNGYLLSKHILQLENPHYPLTVQQALIDCNAGKSAWDVFHIYKKWDLDTLLNFTNTLNAHLDNVTNVEVPHVDLLGGDANSYVQKLRDAGVLSVRWTDCVHASTSALYAGATGNFTRLRAELLSLSSVVAEKPSSPSHALLIAAVQRVLDKLHPVKTVQTNLETAQQTLNASCVELSNFDNVRTTVEGDLRRFTEFDQRFNGQHGAAAVLTASIQSAVSRVSDASRAHTAITKYTIQEELGICTPLQATFNGTVYPTCNKYLDGMDEFWVALVMNAVLMVFAMLLSHHLAYFFLDQEQWKQAKKFIFCKDLVYRVFATGWFLLDFILNIIIVHKLHSDDFRESYCCPTTAQVTGIALISVTGILIIPLHIYVFIVLANAHAAKNVRVESYWVFRKRSVQFFANLLCFFLEDVPFIVLTGIYIQGVGYADGVSVAALIVTLLGALGFISNSAGQRKGDIRRYFQWLKFRLNPRHCMKSDDGENQAREEMSEFVAETELGSQFGVQGQYVCRSHGESLPSINSSIAYSKAPSSISNGTNSKASRKTMEIQQNWQERESAVNGAMPLPRNFRQLERPRRSGQQRYDNNYLANQTYYELSVDQPVRNGQTNGSDSQKKMKRRLSNKQRSRQHLTERALDDSSGSDDADNKDISNRPPFRRSGRKSRSGRKQQEVRHDDEFAYDATWERPVRRPGTYWSDDDATIRRSRNNHSQQRRAGGLSVEV
ncbi:uncharacterized protein LOC134179846 isoform X3 [Corticium candelabrum]|nr:uncharacterized protein LOC134179846 isoform X3 [Corticium candelabrum]